MAVMNTQRCFALSSSLPLLWSVIRMRYLLLWAQVRTKKGRIALFVALEVVGVTTFLFLSLGGVGAALASVRLGLAEKVARWVLTAMFLNGVALSLTLGAGPRMAFADAVLRRYPMRPHSRLIVRHLTGLIEPVWMFFLALAVGLAVGFALMGVAALVVALPAMLLYTAICYLTALVLLSFLERTLVSDKSAAILSASVVATVTIGGVSVPFFSTHRIPGLWRGVDEALRFMPPGVAASVLGGTDAGIAVFDIAIMSLWCLGLAYALAGLEGWQPAVRRADVVRMLEECWFDKATWALGGRLAPMVGKSLRYHWRCNRVRFNALISIPMTVLLPVMMGKSGGAREIFLAALALFFIAGIGATNTITLNQFGYDRAGIRRYPILPAPMVSAVHAGSIASLMIGGGVVVVALMLWTLFAPFAMDGRMGLMIFSSGCAGLLYFNALGLWVTILCPRSCDFRSLTGNQLSTAGMTVLLSGTALALVAAYELNETMELPAILARWWAPPLSVILSGGLYVLSFRIIQRAVPARRDSLINAIDRGLTR